MSWTSPWSSQLGGLGAARLCETADGVSALPETALGKAALNAPFTASGALGTALGPKIEHTVLPPNQHHGHE
jgi:hypothetical protein